jgi:DNA-binding SARP family transcriptional activator
VTRLTLTLLGGFRAHLGPKPLTLSRRAQVLLAYLALAPGEPHRRTRLSELFWGEGSSERARNGLGQALAELRRALGARSDDYIAVDPEWVELRAADLHVDVVTVERLAAEGTAAALGEAASLCRGDFLAGCGLRTPSFESWLVAERARVRAVLLRVLTPVLAQQVAAGETLGAIDTASRTLALDPLREAAHRALMRVYAGTGRLEDALRQYQVCADALRRDLGVEPEAETRDLQREIAARSA